MAEETIALLSMMLPRTLEANRPDIEQAVSKGLATSGRLIEGPQAILGKLAGKPRPDLCQDRRCWAGVGEALGTTYFVLGMIDGPNRANAYVVRFELFESATGRSLGSESNACDSSTCSTADFARLSAKELVRHTLVRALPPPPPVAPARPPEAVAVPSPSNQTPTPAAIGRQGDRSWPWLAVFAGGALAAGGSVLYAIDGHLVDCETVGPRNICYGRLETKTLGLLSVGLGVASMVTGVWMLQTTVAVTPGGVAIAGRF